MAVKEVTRESFSREVLESDAPVVVDFYADWCGPCHALAPEIEALARKWDERVTFAKLDVDQAPGVAQRYGVVSIPTVLLFEGGEVKASAMGAKPGEVLEQELGLAGDELEEATGHSPACAC